MAAFERDATCGSPSAGLRAVVGCLGLFALAWSTAALAQATSTKDAPVYLQGDSLRSRTDVDATLEGNAELRKGGTLIRADRLDYDMPTDTARATGHVWVQRNGNTYQGPYLELGIDAFQGFFTAPRYEFGENGAHGQAARAEFVDNAHMTVYQASYTTCRRQPGPDWLPDWVLTAARIDIDNDEDIGLAQSAVLSFKGFPLLHVLPISFPLSEKRKSGMLSPTIGLDNANGLELFASTLLAKNVYQAGFRPQADERSVMKLSRALVLVIMAVALVFALIFPSALVNLLLIGYDGVSQFFPGMILGLFWKGARAAGVLTGLLAGVGVVSVLVFTGHDPWAGLNAGFIALAVNAAITVGVSLALGQKPGLSR